MADELNWIAETTSFGGKSSLTKPVARHFKSVAVLVKRVIGLKNMRTDDINISGFSYVANGMASDRGKSNQPEWYDDVVYRPFWSAARDLPSTRKQAMISKSWRLPINGQTDLSPASVNDEGQLQLHMSGEDTRGHDLFFRFISQWAFDVEVGYYESVDDITVTDVGGVRSVLSLFWIQRWSTWIVIAPEPKSNANRYFDYAINTLKRSWELGDIK